MTVQTDEQKKAARLAEKQAKFKELAVKRVEKALAAIAMIGGLSARGNYDYTAEQVEKIGGALQAELDKLGARFSAALAGQETKAETGFSL